jgi:hypothetical protein
MKQIRDFRAGLTGIFDNLCVFLIGRQFKLYNDLTTSGQGESFYVDGQLEESKLKVLSR